MTLCDAPKKLDPRLACAAQFVRAGAVFADIGTDHAYLPIALLTAGKIAYAVAADIAEKPLVSARAHLDACAKTHPGLYEKTENGTDDFIYLLMNMHWTDHVFALVQLPDGYRWRVAFSTKDIVDGTVREQEAQEGRGSITVMPRSIVVLAASKDKEENRKEAKA